MVSVCVRKEISRADLDAAPTNLRVSRDDHAVKECQAAPHRCHMAGTLRFVWRGMGMGSCAGDIACRNLDYVLYYFSRNAWSKSRFEDYNHY